MQQSVKFTLKKDTNIWHYGWILSWVCTARSCSTRV